MSRGGPDGNLQPYNYAGNQADISLVSQMLWGFAPVDGQGRVWYLDTFNNGLGGVILASSGGSSTNPTLYTAQGVGAIYSPPNAIQLNPGADGSAFSYIMRKYYLGKNARIGMEMSIQWSDITPNYYMTMDYRIAGGNPYIPRLQFDNAAGNWKILTNTGYVTIVHTGILAGNPMLQQIKMVVDFSAGKYVRALIGDNLIDLSQYTMQASVNSFDGFCIATFGGVSFGAASSIGIIGYILLTKDEP